MRNHNMIILQCPQCKDYMAVETDALRQSETILCPHCHRESSINEALNRKNKINKNEQFLSEMQLFAQNISEIDVNKKIGQLYRKYNISPTVAAFIVNCLLDEHPIEDFPPLFLEFEGPGKVSLSSYLSQLEHVIAEKKAYEPVISVSAHVSDAMKIIYQHKINELEKCVAGQKDELNNSYKQIEELNILIDNKQKEINDLKDKIAFLRLKI